MVYQLVTLFDLNYLPRGLVLYRSLVAAGVDFRLRVLCLDERTADILEHVSLPKVAIMRLADVEHAYPELVAVKPSRSRTEYAWTLTPASCLYALEHEPALEEITYLDADLRFFADPAPIFTELGDDSVLITPHRYAPEWAHLEPLSGRFNVQFMTFRRDDRGLAALRWWHDRCIEWCYQRHEDRKFGDQMYLDDWPTRFPGVHVLEHPGALAPWNVGAHELSQAADRILVDERELVFFHFHGLRPRETALGRLTWSAIYPQPPVERRLLWEPYVAELEQAVRDVRALAPDERAGVDPFSSRDTARRLARRIVPRPVRASARRAIASVPRSRTWESPSVAQQHLDLVRDQLEHPEDVPPFRTFLELIAALVDDVDLPAPARLLDFGCGAGHYSELLERHFPGRFDYTGCDGSPEMVARAQRQWPGRGFVVNDLFTNALDLDSFDVIFAGAVVDVIAEYERALDVLLGNGARHVLLHRQRITDGPSRVEPAQGYRGQSTVATFLNIHDLERTCARHNREVARSFSVENEVRSFMLPLVDSA